MWRCHLVVLTVTACLSACQGASVAETELDSRVLRLGNVVRYFQTSWDHLVSGQDIVEVQNTDEGVASLGLTETSRVVILVHGRESSVYDDFAETVKFSLAQADPDLVIILVDWAFMSLYPYNQAVTLVPPIAADLRDFIIRLNTVSSTDESETSEEGSGTSEEGGGQGGTRQLDLKQLHLIGFDLGAHIVGVASRNAASRAVKITALDPAGENWGSSSQRLRSTDADTVEVLHTDVVGNRAYGLADEVGTLDIFVNTGTRQPGCSNNDNLCHHNRAYKLFAATVDTGGHLLALKCDSMTQVNNNRCTGTPAVFVGTTALQKVQRGLYRVTTGSIYPFAP